ncbi:MAG: MFS transporter, partial [Calditrichaeota bacterium]
MKNIFQQLFKLDKSVYGWALYDWANSAFVTTVMAGFFPIFFKEYWSAGTDVNVSTAQLGMGNSLASMIVALMAPVLGAIADRGSARKKFLIFFAYWGVLMTVGLFLVEKGEWAWAIFAYVMGVIGFSGANIFYDALLPEVAGEDNIDYVSGFGYALGYLGGGVLFLINVLMVLHPEWFGLPDSATAVRYSFLSVGVWWGVFTIFTILWVKETPSTRPAERWWEIVVGGFRQLGATFAKLRHLKTVFLFLAAYWLYIDGVDTIIRMATDYGLSIGFQSTDLILALLLVQFVGFPSSIIYTRLGQRWGARKGIFLGIGAYSLVTLWGTQMSSLVEFYGLAVTIGLVQGGIQALSRSYFSRLIPADQAGEFYGFYNMLGKFAAILGPILMGGVGLQVKKFLVARAGDAADMAYISQLASRWSIAAVLLLFVGGA